MQVVIPMSGFGERFRRAGYTVPKPLIPVHGRPVIGHVVDMFPGVDDIIFICNKDHLDEPAFRMREILRELRPNGRVIGIEAHKLGPVHAVLLAQDAIDPVRPTIINYCDFTCYWSFAHFKDYVARLGCDGAIPAYTGFHPHMMGSVNYAYVREQNGWALDIQEKQPYTDNPMAEYASSGTYYFKSGALALHYCAETVRQQLMLKGEYYASLVYRPMLKDGLGVAVYPLQHFMQWGTPEDMAIYNNWARMFERLIADDGVQAPQTGTVMIPMAGAGARFTREGYAEPKPLIPVSGLPMAMQAARDLPAADRHIFILRQDLPQLARIQEALKDGFPAACLVTLTALTDGQARTCLLALGTADPDAPLTIGACDNGMLYDRSRFEALMGDPNVDIIVWVARGHPNAARKPEMYGWVATEGAAVTRVSVKVPLSDPAHDPIVIGTFTFKRASDFKAAAERMIAQGTTVNGEYYVDACINDALALGLKAAVLEVDAYICWGTPDELRTFEYWQSCFHKWPGHPYRLELDKRVPAGAVDDLARRYAQTLPPLPGPRP